MTGQVLFDSHVLTLVEVSTHLVNNLTPGHRGGYAYDAPVGVDRIHAAASALGSNGRRTPDVTASEADTLAQHAIDMRQAFQAVHDGNLALAANTINALLAQTGARPSWTPWAAGGTSTSTAPTTPSSPAGRLDARQASPSPSAAISPDAWGSATPTVVTASTSTPPRTAADGTAPRPARTGSRQPPTGHESSSRVDRAVVVKKDRQRGTTSRSTIGTTAHHAA